MKMLKKSPKQQFFIIGVCLSMFVSSVLFLILNGYTSVPVGGESQEGSGMPLWTIAIPTAVGLLLTRTLPPRFSILNPLSALTHEQVYRSLYAAVIIAITFPVLVFIAGIVIDLPTVWVVLKVPLFLLLPVVILWHYNGMPTVRAPTQETRLWYWMGPFVVSLTYIVLRTIGPFAPERMVADKLLDPSAMMTVLLTSLIVNFVTAGLAEELFFRALLQTRLEALLGRWGGILVAALLFALMHLPFYYAVHWSGQTGAVTLDMLLALATAVSVNGTMGSVLGYLWARYRNFWMVVLLHTGINVVPFYLHVLEVI